MSSTVPSLPLPGLAGEPPATPQPGVASLCAPASGSAAAQADAASSFDDLVRRIDALLPQTQCTRCGYPDCRAYALALAEGGADLNQCPPGGAEGVVRLARLLDRPARPLAPAHGAEGPRRLVFIDEATCIGCTLCIQVCPVDAIIGAPKRMHAVVESTCTGCELCLPVCPVDCIVLEDASAGATGWAAWSPAQADAARTRYARRATRLARDEHEHAQRLAARVAARQAHVARGAGTAAPSTVAGATAAAIVRPADAAGPTVDTAAQAPPRSTPAVAIPASADAPSRPSLPSPGDAAPADPKRAAVEAALVRARLRAKMRPS